MEERIAFFQSAKDELSLKQFLWCLTFHVDDGSLVQKHFPYVCEENAKCGSNYIFEVFNLLIEILDSNGFNPPMAGMEEDGDEIWFDDDQNIEECYSQIKVKQFLNGFDYLPQIVKMEEAIAAYDKSKEDNRRFDSSVLRLCLRYNPVIIYSLKSKVGFGEFKGRTVEYILAHKPSQIVFYVNNLNHLTISADVLIHPQLIRYLGDDYWNFASLSLYKNYVTGMLMSHYDYINYICYPDDDTNFRSYKSDMDAYYAAYEYFPEDDD